MSIICPIVKIYCLKDPDTNEIRYIGKTIQNINCRLATHCCRNRNYKQKNQYNHTEAWVRSLINNNKKPIIEIIEEVDFIGWEEKEIYYIKHFKELGCNLTNHSVGGDKSNFGSRWKLKDRSSMENRLNSRRKPCVVIDLITQIPKNFSSFVAASEFMNISSASNINKKKHVACKRYIVLTEIEYNNLKNNINVN